MERVAVVGAGLAGLRAAQRLREKGFDGDITIVGDEPHRPYNRPPLSKQVLAGEQTADDCAFECDDAQATWLLDNPATGLDVEQRIVRLRDGELSYDGLVIATGRRARDWPNPLPAMTGFHLLRGLDDTLALQAAVTPDSRVVIVGGGFIGCEVAATLLRRGLTDITIVEVAPYLLPALGSLLGGYAVDLHTSRGIAVECGIGVSAFIGDTSVEAVELTDGRRLDADIVLFALGSIPNTEWLSESGLSLSAGTVVCDEYCFASGQSDIVAAGDVATWTHLGVGQPVRVEHWTNAAEMARAAVDNLFVGRDESTPFMPVPTFWSDQHDVKIKAAGFAALVDDFVIVDSDAARSSLVVEGYAGGKLVSAITCNQPKAYLKYRSQFKPIMEISVGPTVASS